MTATTMQSRRVSVLPLILLAVLSTAVGAILLGTHATERHSEATAIRECLKQNGAIQTWQTDDDPNVRCYVVELEPCKTWAILIAQVWPSIVDNCEMRERTSFIPRDGSPEKVLRYLEQFARRIR